jgi:serine/threonine protein kinase
MGASPKRLGKYELLTRLGQGGMAEVWKAFDPQLQRMVAIKFMHANLRSDPDFVSRFVREGQAIATLHHPNIVQVYDFQVSSPEDENPMAYMVMAYIEGETLADYLLHTSYAGNIPAADEIVHLFTSLGLAVDYAHQHGIIHRDIKPANILLDACNTIHNPMGEPILTDFGIVKMLGAAAITSTGISMGTPLYISPEQVHGQPGNEKSDIYALNGIHIFRQR